LRLNTSNERSICLRSYSKTPLLRGQKPHQGLVSLGASACIFKVSNPERIYMEIDIHFGIPVMDIDSINRRALQTRFIDMQPPATVGEASPSAC